MMPQKSNKFQQAAKQDLTVFQITEGSRVKTQKKLAT